jgi:hypothetical protein
LGINPGKIAGPQSAPALASAGGWVGAKPPRHNARAGRTGVSGRGNDYGAAQRLAETEDVIMESLDRALVGIDLAPEITTINEPTYAEQLNSIQTPAGGIEFLWSGTDPVDPRDCALWPDSPYCGGSAVDFGGIGMYGPEPAAMSINVSVSRTEILVQIDPSIFGVNLPPVWMGFRRPGAQDAVEEYWGPGGLTSTPAGYQSFGGPGSEITWVVFRETWGVQSVSERFSDSAYMESFRQKVFNTVPPYATPTAGNGPPAYRFAYMNLSVGEGFDRYRIDRAADALPYPPLPVGEEGPSGNYIFFKGRIERWLTLNKQDPPRFPDGWPYEFSPDFTPYGTFTVQRRNSQPSGIVREFTEVIPQAVYPPRLTAIPYLPPMPPPPPPTLPPRSPATQPEDPMACDCKKIEDLLKKILALLDHSGTRELDLTPCETDPDAPSGNRKYTWQGKGLKGVFDALEKLTDGTTETYQSSKCVAPALGVKKLPWNLPENMGNGQGSQTISNYAELQLYFLKQLSQMLGQTEIKVKVKDSNLAQGGNQEIELKFANLSEAIAELAGLALTNQALSSASLNAAMTSTVQAGMAFSTAAVVDRNLGEILEYLGFAVQRKTFEAPLAYTPGKNSPEEFLRDSTAKLSYWRNDDRNTLQNHISTLEQAAAIIRAAFFERISEGSDGEEDIKTKIREAVGGVGGDFDTFLDRVENGYIDEAGTQDTTPYGRPFNERPRIRKISAGGTPDGTNP